MFPQKPFVRKHRSGTASPQKPLTSSQILAARKESVFDVFVGANGDAAVKVTGVPKPFEFVIPARLLRDHAAFGRPTRASIMRCAQTITREKLLTQLEAIC